jgi:hypothetical protein
LDVSFPEDLSRKRDRYATQNFSMINRIALNLIMHERSSKRSFRRKRLDAGWNYEYLWEIITNKNAFTLSIAWMQGKQPKNIRTFALPIENLIYFHHAGYISNRKH